MGGSKYKQTIEIIANVLQIICQSIGTLVMRSIFKLLGKNVKNFKNILITTLLILIMLMIMFNSYIIGWIISTIEVTMSLTYLGAILASRKRKKYSKLVSLNKHPVTNEKLALYSDLAQQYANKLWTCQEVLEVSPLKTSFIKTPEKFNDLLDFIEKAFVANIDKVKGLENINKKSLWLGHSIPCYGKELDAAIAMNNHERFGGIHLEVLNINYIDVSTPWNNIGAVYAMMHELAHNITSREDMADYITISICLMSNSKLLMYCGLSTLLYHCAMYKSDCITDIPEERDYKRCLEYLPENTDWVIIPEELECA